MHMLHLSGYTYLFTNKRFYKHECILKTVILLVKIFLLCRDRSFGDFAKNYHTLFNSFTRSSSVEGLDGISLSVSAKKFSIACLRFLLSLSSMALRAVGTAGA